MADHDKPGGHHNVHPSHPSHGSVSHAASSQHQASSHIDVDKKHGAHHQDHGGAHEKKSSKHDLHISSDSHHAVGKRRSTVTVPGKGKKIRRAHHKPNQALAEFTKPLDRRSHPHYSSIEFAVPDAKHHGAFAAPGHSEHAHHAANEHKGSHADAHACAHHDPHAHGQHPDEGHHTPSSAESIAFTVAQHGSSHPVDAHHHGHHDSQAYDSSSHHSVFPASGHHPSLGGPSGNHGHHPSVTGPAAAGHGHHPPAGGPHPPVHGHHSSISGSAAPGHEHHPAVGSPAHHEHGHPVSHPAHGHHSSVSGPAHHEHGHPATHLGHGLPSVASTHHPDPHAHGHPHAVSGHVAHHAGHHAHAYLAHGHHQRAHPDHGHPGHPGHHEPHRDPHGHHGPSGEHGHHDPHGHPSAHGAHGRGAHDPHGHGTGHHDPHGHHAGAHGESHHHDDLSIKGYHEHGASHGGHHPAGHHGHDQHGTHGGSGHHPGHADHPHEHGHHPAHGQRHDTGGHGEHGAHGHSGRSDSHGHHQDHHGHHPAHHEHHGSGYHSPHPSAHSHHAGDELARKYSDKAGKLLSQYGRDTTCPAKPSTPGHNFSGRACTDREPDLSRTPTGSGRYRPQTQTTHWGAALDEHGSPIERIQETLELELTRRRHCEKIIANVQATILEANEEVAAMAEQSRRRELLLAEKEEKLRMMYLEHSNMENFLRSSMDETCSKYRTLCTEYDQERAEWRSADSAYCEKIMELENRIKILREDLKNSKHRLAEYETERNRLLCTVKEAEQEIFRAKSTSHAERQRLETAKCEQKKRIEELVNELESLKKYGEHQERKCHDLEDRLSRTESQLDNALRCKQSAEREVAEQAAMQQSTMHEVTRALRAEYDTKVCENDKQYRREIEKVTCSNRRNEQDIEAIRDEIRADYEDRIARLKVDYKLKENNYEKHVSRMVDKMRQYEQKLEGIVRDKEKEPDNFFKAESFRRSSPIRSKTTDWKDTCQRYTDSNWRKDYGSNRVGDVSITLNTAKKLLDDTVTSPRRIVIQGTYIPRLTPRRRTTASPDSGRRSCSLRRSNYWT